MAFPLWLPRKFTPKSECAMLRECAKDPTFSMLNAKVMTVRLEKDMSVPSLLKRTWQHDLGLQSHTCKNQQRSLGRKTKAEIFGKNFIAIVCTVVEV